MVGVQFPLQNQLSDRSCAEKAGMSRGTALPPRKVGYRVQALFLRAVTDWCRAPIK